MMVHSPTVRIVLILLLVQLAHSWNADEWGDPFTDSRFRRLPKSCTYGYEQWNCTMPHSECQGAPQGFCYCSVGFINPDPPGTDTSKTGLRCLKKDETTIPNGDPRWKQLFLPCTVNCTASQAECSKELGQCICGKGLIGDPATKYNTCKAVEGSGTRMSTSLVANVLVTLGALLLIKNA